MALQTGFSIISLARIQLNDPDRDRWTDEELIGWLNAGQREIVILKPEACAKVQALALAANTALQSLPSTSLKLLDVTCNLGVDGSTPGRTVTLVMKSELDRIDPLWRTKTGGAIKHYVYDGRVPRSFMVYPAPSQVMSVETQVSVAPDDCTLAGVDGATTNSAISIDDVYATALLDYVMMRAHYKDTDVKSDAEGTVAYNRFLQRLGLKVIADKASDPNRNAPPRDQKRALGAPDGQAAF